MGRKFCPKTGDRCYGKCHPKGEKQLQVVGSDAVWYRPTTLDQLFKIIAANPGKKVRIVFGNTGSGIVQPYGTTGSMIQCISINFCSHLLYLSTTVP